MSAIAEFFRMGGYAQFVWPAYGVTALVMAALAWRSWRALRGNEAKLDELQGERRAARDAVLAGAAEGERRDA